MVTKSHIFLWISAGLMAATGVWLLINGADTAKVVAAFGGAIATALLPRMERWLEVRLPTWLEVWFGLFILGSLILGTVFGMYEHWRHWDSLLHALSGVLVAGFGMVLLHQRIGKLQVALPVWGRVVLVGMFSASVALTWEIAEFLSDELVGTRSQHSNADTMTDMIFGTVTGIITAIGYYSVRKLASKKKTR